MQQKGKGLKKTVMTEGTASLEDIVTAPQKAVSRGRLGVFAIGCAAVAIVCSAFEFRPFQHSRSWQMLCPTNFAALVWTVILTVCLVRKSSRKRILQLVPHLSVLAYLTINILSIAFAAEIFRAVSFVGKLLVMLLGGYVLLSYAVYNRRTFRFVLGLITAASVICVTGCLVSRFVFAGNQFGFYDNCYKYGTYAATMSSLAAAYLLASPAAISRVFGAVLISATLLSAGSFGAVVAVVTAMPAAMLVMGRRQVGFYISASLIVTAVITILLNANPNIIRLQEDISLVEKDGVTLKQRYVEWQAEINLLERRAITGTGAGCINDYRSSFYYRLPKLNTLKPFDQNGYLATCAETGMLGLVCFCWIVLHYGRLAVLSVRKAAAGPSQAAYRFAVAGFAGLVAVCAANVFCSAQYNGVLIAFVLVVVVISRTQQLFFAGAMKCQ